MASSNTRVTLVILAVIALFLASAPALNAAEGTRPATGETAAVATTNAPTLAPAISFRFDNILGNRSRMIQVTFIVLAIGIGLLMWGKGK